MNSSSVTRTGAAVQQLFALRRILERRKIEVEPTTIESIWTTHREVFHYGFTKGSFFKEENHSGLMGEFTAKDIYRQVFALPKMPEKCFFSVYASTPVDDTCTPDLGVFGSEPFVDAWLFEGKFSKMPGGRMLVEAERWKMFFGKDGRMESQESDLGREQKDWERAIYSPTNNMEIGRLFHHYDGEEGVSVKVRNYNTEFFGFVEYDETTRGRGGIYVWEETCAGSGINNQILRMEDVSEVRSLFPGRTPLEQYKTRGTFSVEAITAGLEEPKE